MNGMSSSTHQQQQQQQQQQQPQHRAKEGKARASTRNSFISFESKGNTIARTQKYTPPTTSKRKRWKIS